MEAMSLCQSFDHIDNRELARLATLWKAQASSSQVEASGIASALAIEQRRRLKVDISQKMTMSVGSRNSSWWRLWQQMIFTAIPRINTAWRSRHSRPD